MLVVSEDPVALQVWCFDESHFFFVGRFALPLTAKTGCYHVMQFCGNPSSSLAGAKTLDGTPFALSPVSDVLGIEFGVSSLVEGDVRHPQRTQAFFTMIMRPSLMFDALRARSVDHLASETLKRRSGDRLEVWGSLERCLDVFNGCIASDYIFHKTLEWQEWGPQCTRWLPHKPPDIIWQPSLAGGRFAFVTAGPSEIPESGLRPLDVIRLYDFRPEIVTRYTHTFPQDICSETSVIPKGALFQEDVISTLPYHIATSKEQYLALSGAMIDEGRLVVPNVNICSLFIFLTSSKLTGTSTRRNMMVNGERCLSSPSESINSGRLKLWSHQPKTTISRELPVVTYAQRNVEGLMGLLPLNLILTLA